MPSFLLGAICQSPPCSDQAEGFLVAPARNWAIPYCRTHGKQAAKEYWLKLGQPWTYESGQKQTDPNTHNTIRYLSGV